MVSLALAALFLQAPRHWSLLLGGDVMLNGVRPGPKNLASLSPAFHQCDLCILNLEVPLTSHGRPTDRKTKNELKARTQFVLRADPNHAKWLFNSGITAVSLANNHAMDYGSAGVSQMIQALDKYNIKHCGAGNNLLNANSLLLLTLHNGLRVGILAALAFNGAAARFKCTPATTSHGGVATVDGLLDRIRASKSRCDVLIVGLHGGTERRPTPTLSQIIRARECIDAGADIILGHHPHVLEGAEWYRGRPILYSMGNLISPTPATSGLVRFGFSGTTIISCSFLPISIRGGISKPLHAKFRPIALQSFNILADQAANLSNGVPLHFGRW